jgi:FKBP-type peptidyl-prolyl cis-trans isomerase SlyD
MGQTIKKGDFVKISYTAKLEDKTVIDSTDAEVAKQYGIYNENARYGDIMVVVGERHVIRGLDEALGNKETGYKGEVTVPPEKAFGEYNRENKEVINIARLKERPSVGQRIRVDNRVGVVERIIGRRAIVDFNHPLAGKNIIFEFEIKKKIVDDAEKAKALFLIYTGREVDIKVNGRKIIVELPRELSIDQYFAIGKFSAINGIFKHLDVDEVEIIERFRKEEEKPEVEKQPEQEVEEKSEEKSEP